MPTLTQLKATKIEFTDQLKYLTDTWIASQGLGDTAYDLMKHAAELIGSSEDPEFIEEAIAEFRKLAFEKAGGV